ncbi:hypothetical protein V6N13_123411 [Hibiscus sabdariffa]
MKLVEAASEIPTNHDLELDEINKLKMCDVYKLSYIEMIQRGSNRKLSMVDYAIKVTLLKNMANTSARAIAEMHARYKLKNDQVNDFLAVALACRILQFLFTDFHKSKANSASL